VQPAVAPSAPAAEVATAAPARKVRGAHHRSLAHHARRGGGRVVAAAGSAGAGRKPSAKSDDLDDLLKRFK
jgi:hypothetical protein